MLKLLTLSEASKVPNLDVFRIIQILMGYGMQTLFF